MIGVRIALAGGVVLATIVAIRIVGMDDRASVFSAAAAVAAIGALTRRGR